MRSRVPTGLRTRTVTSAAGLLGLLVSAAPGLAQPPVAAVVPFTNVSRQPADDWIGAGIAETVAADVQRVGMAVVGWGAGGLPGTGGAAADAGATAPGALAAWRDRGVSWFVDGTLQRVGDRLRITTRVVDVASGAVAFNTRVDGTWQDLFETEDRVAAAVADWLSSRPAPPVRSARLSPAARPSSTAPPAPPARPAGAFVPSARAERAPAAPPPASASALAPAPPAEPPPRAFPSGGRAAAGADTDPLAGNGAAGSGNGVTGALVLPGPGRGRGPMAAPAAPPRRSGGGGFAPAPIGRPTATVARTFNPPAIDGRLDDSAWETATHVTDFVQVAPVEGAPGSEATEVWMAFDSDHLYFAFHAHYSDPGIMRVNRADREEIRGDDRMSVLFDPFLDQQRAYQFEVNGYGVQADSIVNADGSTGFSRGGSSSSARRGGGGGSRGGSGSSASGQFGIRGDQSWNALFHTAGRIVDDGWVAEMRIPFKSLRYPSRPAGVGHRWGFQITRIIRGKSEAQSWSPISRGVAGQITQFGQLEGLSDLSLSRNLELLPEVTGYRFGRSTPPTGCSGMAIRPGRAGVRRQVRDHPQPDGGLHLQPRLLPDRVGPAAGRDQPAVRALLRRAAAVLPRRAGDLPDRDAADPGAHPHHRRPPLRRQADRQGRPSHPRGPGGQRRCGGFPAGSGRCAGRRGGPDGDRPRPLRPLFRVVRRRDHDRPRVRAGLQPGGGRGRPLPARPEPSRELPGDGVGHRGPGTRGPLGAGDRGGLLARGAQPELQRRLQQHRSRIPDPHGVPPPRRPAPDERQRRLSLVAGIVDPHVGAVGDLPAALRPRRRAAGRADSGHGQLLVPEQHLVHGDGEPRPRAVSGGRVPEDRVRVLQRHQLADRVAVRRVQLGPRHSLRSRRPVPGAVDLRQRQLPRAADVAAAHRAPDRVQQLRQPPERRGSVRREDLPGADDVSVHRPVAAAVHPGAQHLGRDPRQQPVDDLPHQRGHRPVPGLRRPIPERGGDRQRHLPDDGVPADEPGLLRQGLLYCSATEPAVAGPGAARRAGSRSSRVDD